MDATSKESFFEALLKSGIDLENAILKDQKTQIAGENSDFVKKLEKIRKANSDKYPSNEKKDLTESMTEIESSLINSQNFVKIEGGDSSPGPIVDGPTNSQPQQPQKEQVITSN